MSHEQTLILALSLLVICCTYYAWRSERMRRLGEALYEANDRDLETAYLAVHNCELERDLVRFQGRTPARVWRDAGKPRDAA